MAEILTLEIPQDTTQIGQLLTKVEKSNIIAWTRAYYSFLQQTYSRCNWKPYVIHGSSQSEKAQATTPIFFFGVVFFSHSRSYSSLSLSSFSFLCLLTMIYCWLNPTDYYNLLSLFICILDHSVVYTAKLL